MNANQITVGKKYLCKVGRNEVEVEVSETLERGWKVKSASSGKIFTVKSEKSFVKELAPAGEKKLSMLDAAAEVLKASSQPMSSAEMVAAMEVANLWTSPNGKTPQNTLYSAILREIKLKTQSRFCKTAKGRFEFNPEAANA